MILGAVSDNPRKPIDGKYKPEEFGKITLWQLRNLFGYRAKETQPSAQELFWNARRVKGQSEFEIWRAWNDEVRPGAEAIERRQQAMNPLKTF